MGGLWTAQLVVNTVQSPDSKLFLCKCSVNGPCSSFLLRQLCSVSLKAMHLVNSTGCFCGCFPRAWKHTALLHILRAKLHRGDMRQL